VIPNYRLYPQVKFPAFVDDIAQSVVWAHAHAAEFGGDPRRLFIMGHSAGAQIGAMIAFNDEYLKQAGGDTSWLRGFIGLAGPYDFLPFKDEYLRDVFGPEPRYPLSQPVNFVSEHSVPALLIHGDADQKVWPSNSRSLASTMRKHGDRVVERYYPDMNHTDVVAAFSVYFRGHRSILDEIEAFVGAEAATTESVRR
jgi:acetyl esterase/lipase